MAMDTFPVEPADQESDKPPSCSPNTQWLVAIIANVKGETPLAVDSPPDAGAEFDRSETISAIREAIESVGHSAVFIPADASLPFALHELRPDICFNIAEGLGGDSREAQVPALLEMIGIPYTGSRVLANAISLDKTMTKRLWRDANLPVASFQEFTNENDRLRPGLRYPLFVKPAREGTGMGVDSGALVHNEQELRRRVEWVIATYRQPALVEAYLPGREFTVGVLGRPGAASAARRPELYSPDGFHRFPISEVETHNSATPGMYGHTLKSKDLWEEGAPGIICPPALPPRLEADLHRLARRAHQVIGALDISRVDIRLDSEGQPNLMEINTLPGLTPHFSDLCIMLDAEGLEYRDLILEILYLAAARFNLTRIPATVGSFKVSHSHLR